MDKLMEKSFQYPVSKSSKTRLEQAEERTAQAETRTEQAKTRIETAETRAEQAQTRTESAKTRTEHAETRAEEAESHMEKAKVLVESLVETLGENQAGGQSAPVPPVVTAVNAADLRAFERLNTRQREVLALIAIGENTKQIAGTLKISPKTVEYHRKKLMDSLDIHDIPGLVRFALRVETIGLIPAKR